MSLELLQTVWFLLLGFLMTGYAILDGFDLGVGIIHLYMHSDRDRRMLLNSIGPIWDGNAVWLITFGGALMATFPAAFATAFSSFYLPFMLLLYCLIFRTVSMEFRSKRPGPLWRQLWDMAFSASCTLASFLFGVAVGNMAHGLPINQEQIFVGNIVNLLHPYAILTGLFVVSLFAMHGSIYLCLKTEGELQEHARRIGWVTYGIFIIFYLLTAAATLVFVPNSSSNFTDRPWIWPLVFVAFLATAYIPIATYLGQFRIAFIASCLTILEMVTLFGIALFPNLVTSTLNPEWSLTIFNSSSTFKSLAICLGVVILGFPFVASYLIAINMVFRGKVKLNEHSY